MQNVKLNLIPGSVMPVVNVSQYDKARQFSLTVYEGSATYSLTGKDVQIRGTKPDGNGFAYDSTDGVVSVSGSTVTISTTQQMTAVGGQTMAELRITQSGVILGTLNFVLMVEPSALSDDTPISDTDIPAIERDFEAALAEAEADALKAEGYAVGTQDGTPAQSGEPYYQDNAKYYKEQAEAAASGGGADALKAEGYAVGTQNGVPVGSGSPYYENNAKYYEGEAATSASNASTSETNAGTSETNAGLSATAAGNSANAAAASALVSEGWSNGEQNGVPVSSGSPYYQDNAKYWKDQAAQYASGGLIFQGSIAFASIPTTGLTNGDMYNITDAFTTDSRFIEGAGISVAAGTNIAWIDSVSKWDLLSSGGGSGSLSGLTDVTITSAATGQVLEFDGSKWVNAGLSIPSDLDDLSDVTLSTPSSDQLLKYDGSKWVNGQDALSKLSDVTLTTPSSGQFLKYDGAKWVNGTGGGGASALDDLTDVDITTPTDGQVLTYDAVSQKWVNANGGGGGGGFVLADWLTAGGLNPMSYADLAAVLADEAAVRRLMTIHTAVDYLTQFGAAETNIATILSSNVCAKWITLRDYALDTLMFYFENTMKSLGKYEYGEWAKLSTSPETWGPKGNVPIMTSNTAPYGTANAYQVFDGSLITSSSGTDFNYKFVNPVCVKDFIAQDYNGNAITGGTLQASNDGSTWVTPVADTYYMAWNAHFASSVMVSTLQFYGREMKVSVPVMTSNTAPYGAASASSELNSTYAAWKAFNGAYSVGTSDRWLGAANVTGARVTYKFNDPICVKKACVVDFCADQTQTHHDTTIYFEGSNNGTDWTQLGTLELTDAKKKDLQYVDLNNDNAYLYVSVKFDTYNIISASTNYCGLAELQFYGFNNNEYDWDTVNPRHYLYDHGVELETIEQLSTANGWSQPQSYNTNSQKLPYALYIAPTANSKAAGFGTTNLIDLTSYSLYRLVADPTSAATSGALYTIISPNKTNIESTKLASLWLNIGSNNGSLDVSAINQNTVIAIESVNSASRYGYVYEMWLE